MSNSSTWVEIRGRGSINQNVVRNIGYIIHNKIYEIRRKIEKINDIVNKGPFKSIKSFFHINFNDERLVFFF